MTLGRLKRRSEFEALMATRPVARSAHFSVHHVPIVLCTTAPGPGPGLLSTDPAQTLSASVDNLESSAQVRFGCLVPKRHAKRAVTRNLVRRQMREVVGRSHRQMPAGDWLLRLTNGWPAQAFSSAASSALRRVVAEELSALLASSVQRVVARTGVA
jgi:ribonuclease P protein component